jgi:hypothetical protein
VQKSLEEFDSNHPAGSADEGSGEDETSDDDDGGGTWTEDERCQVNIDGTWYPGTVKKIDLNKEKMLIHFDDGDKDWYSTDEVETLDEEE